LDAEELTWFFSVRSIAVEKASDAGEVACNKPEAQSEGH
jgi:hypothetical protein